MIKTIEELIYELESYEGEQVLTIGRNCRGRVCIQIHNSDSDSPVIKNLYLQDSGL